MTFRASTILAVIGLAVTAAEAGDAAPLRVYVPRGISVSVSELRLDAVCVVQSQDEELAKTAMAVALGRSPRSGEKIVIDRRTILSRLVASGIAADRVQFTGTEQVSVARNEKTVGADQLAQAAEEYLRKSGTGPKEAVYRLGEAPKDLVVLDSAEGLELRPRLAKEAAPGTVKVEVAVVGADGKELGVRQMSFKPAYPRKEMVALADIPADGLLTSENVKVQIVPSDQSAADEAEPALGSALAAPVRAGAVIRASMLKQAKAVSIRRNQSVVMKIQTAQFTLTSLGVALQDGKAGDLIKVQNADSHRVVTAKIAADGAVLPVFEEKP